MCARGAPGREGATNNLSSVHLHHVARLPRRTQSWRNPNDLQLLPLMHAMVSDDAKFRWALLISSKFAAPIVSIRKVRRCCCRSFINMLYTTASKYAFGVRVRVSLCAFVFFLFMRRVSTCSRCSYCVLALRCGLAPDGNTALHRFGHRR